MKEKYFDEHCPCQGCLEDVWFKGYRKAFCFHRDGTKKKSNGLSSASFISINNGSNQGISGDFTSGSSNARLTPQTISKATTNFIFSLSSFCLAFYKLGLINYSNEYWCKLKWIQILFEYLSFNSLWLWWMVMHSWKSLTANRITAVYWLCV